MDEIFGSDYMLTDYTAFETHFSRTLMEVCEFELYDHALSKLGHVGRQYMKIIRSVLGGKNRINARYFSFEIAATRMSGEMNTSLGNGYSNLMIMHAAVGFINGLPPTYDPDEYNRSVVEGDDQVFKTSLPVYPDEAFFASKGFLIKVEHCDTIGETSFCGIVSHEEDPAGATITDPISALLSFAWLTQKYSGATEATCLGLYKCKALSMLYQYFGCPMLQHYAVHILNKLTGVPVRFFKQNMYEDEITRSALKYFSENEIKITEVNDYARILCHKKYAIPEAVQKVFEKSCESGCPNFSVLREFVKKDTVTFSDHYIVKHRINTLSKCRSHKTPLPGTQIPFKVGNSIAYKYG